MSRASGQRRSLQHSREASRGERCPSLRDEHERGRWRLPLEAAQCPHLTAGQGMGAGRAIFGPTDVQDSLGEINLIPT